MTDLVFKGQNGQVLTNSLLVAEKFGKRHADVIRSIDNILNTEDESLKRKNAFSFCINYLRRCDRKKQSGLYHESKRFLYFGNGVEWHKGFEIQE